MVGALVVLVLAAGQGAAVAQPYLYVHGSIDDPPGGENRGPSVLSKIDSATGATVVKIPLGQAAHVVGNSRVVVTPDGGRVFTVNSVMEVIYAIDASSHAFVTSTPSPGVGSLAVSPDGTRLYAVPSGGTDMTIKEYDTATLSLLRSVPLGVAQAFEAVVSPDGARLYVGTYGSNGVKVIDTASFGVVATVPVGALPTGLALSPDGTRLYTANFVGQSVTVVDTTTNTVVTTVNLGSSASDVVVDPIRPAAYITSAGGIRRLNTTTNLTDMTVAVANANAVDVAPDGARLYVSFASAPRVEAFALPSITSAAVYPFDTATQSIPRSLAIGGVADGDADGLPDTWERRFGLDPTSAAGVNGAAGDADMDGRTNAQELADGTHPRGFVKRYLAEGASSTFFNTRLALANPGAVGAVVQLRYLEGDGSITSQTVSVPALQRVTIDPAQTLGAGVHEYSTVVESDELVVVDRTMGWPGGTPYGSHAETALESPATTWYLAEGATGLAAAFNLFYLVQNPNPSPVTASVRYLRGAGLPPITRSYQVPANSRFNIWVNQEGPEFVNAELSAVVTASAPVIVERAMYSDMGGRQFGAGHESAGVTGTSLDWFLAEGATGPYFDLFVLLANPATTAADVEATFYLPDGSTVTKAYTVAGESRFNIWVDHEDTRLADTAVATRIRSLNGVGLVVERAMWWPGGNWHEAHNSPGATETGPRWALAEGEVGATGDVDTYILLANASPSGGDVRVRLLREGQAPLEKVFTVAGSSRFNVSVRDEFPGFAGRFGALVEALGSTPIQLVVERAQYSNFGRTGAHPPAVPLACGSRTRSDNTSAPGTTLEFINNSSDMVRLHWLSYAGQRVFYQNAAPGSDYHWNNSVHMAWEVTDMADRCLVQFEARGTSVTGYIGGEPVRWAAGTNALATKLP